MWPCQHFRAILLPVLRPDIKLGKDRIENRNYRIARLLTPNLESVTSATHRPKSFENRPRFPFFFPFDQSPDRTLNRIFAYYKSQTGNFPWKKEEGLRAEHLVTRERSLRGLS